MAGSLRLKSTTRLLRGTATAVVWGFVTVAILLPAVSLARVVDRGGSQVDLWTATLGSARVRRLIWVTLAQAGASTVLAVVVGTGAAWCAARLEFPGRRLMWSAAAVPFVLPAVVVAAGVAAIKPGATGWPVVIATHAAVNVVLVLRTVGMRMALIPAELESAARLLGRSRWSAAWSVTVRGSVGAIRSAALITATFCLTSFAIVLILGNPSISTVEVEIWVQAVRLGHLDVAAALALGQLAVVGALMWWATRTRETPSGAPGRRRRPDGPAEWGLAVASAGLVITVALLPVWAIFRRVLWRDGSFTLDGLRLLTKPVPGTAGLVTPLESLGWSVVRALLATVIVVAVALPAVVVAARTDWLARFTDLALLVPLGFSAAMVGFGWFLMVREPWFDAPDHFLVVPAIQATVAVPLVIRVVVPQVRALGRGPWEAARLLPGPLWRRCWHAVIVPLRPAITTGLALGFVVALGEFGATAFVQRSATPTAPVLIATLLGRPGADRYSTAMALAGVLALGTAGVFVLADRRGDSLTL
jgi:thiamine transport system permease protein